MIGAKRGDYERQKLPAGIVSVADLHAAIPQNRADLLLKQAWVVTLDGGMLATVLEKG